MNTPLINSVLQQMQPITLAEMKNIRLMDRIDSKFVASSRLLPQLLEEMLPYFKVQTIDNKRIAPYTTQYLDTANLDMFLMHQNGKLNRQKIRIRSYVDSNLSFLEVKNKNNKGRTKKMRVQIAQTHIDSTSDLNTERQFLLENSLFDEQLLRPALANDFQRITLVNNRGTERITIDTDLSFCNYRSGKNARLDNLTVLELKQNGWQHSDFRDVLYNFHIKQQSFSKYCMGTVVTADEKVKYNRFKRKWTMINKIIDN